MKIAQECVFQRQRKQSMCDASHPNISGRCWGISQINQRRFSKIGDLLENIFSKL